MGTGAINFGPTLEQRLNPAVAPFAALGQSINESLRVMVPAVVLAFTPGPPAIVKVQLATREFFQYNENGDDPTAEISIVDEAVVMPILDNLPVQFLTVSGWSITMPIAEGDECMVMFSDVSLDAWFQSGGTDNNQISLRRHALVDGVAVFGLRSTPKGLPAYAIDAVEIRNDDKTVVVRLETGKITITADEVDVNCTTANVAASGTATVQGEHVDVTGSSDVTIKSNVTIDNKLFLSHTHSGVQTGGGTTGPVT